MFHLINFFESVIFYLSFTSLASSEDEIADDIEDKKKTFLFVSSLIKLLLWIIFFLQLLNLLIEMFET